MVLADLRERDQGWRMIGGPYPRSSSTYGHPFLQPQVSKAPIPNQRLKCTRSKPSHVSTRCTVYWKCSTSVAALQSDVASICTTANPPHYPRNLCLEKKQSSSASRVLFRSVSIAGWSLATGYHRQQYYAPLSKLARMKLS